MIAYRGREANGQEQRDGLRRAFPLQKAAYFDTEFTLISGYLHKSLDRLFREPDLSELEKNYLFLRHNLAVTDVLIAAQVLERLYPAIHLYELQVR
jgi:hypothetical protein